MELVGRMQNTIAIIPLVAHNPSLCVALAFPTQDLFNEYSKILFP